MEIPTSSSLLDSLLPKARRGADISAELSELKDFQIGELLQLIETTLITRNNALRMLHSRFSFTQELGIPTPGYRGQKLPIEREMLSLEMTRERIISFLKSQK